MAGLAGSIDETRYDNRYEVLTGRGPVVGAHLLFRALTTATAPLAFGADCSPRHSGPRSGVRSQHLTIRDLGWLPIPKCKMLRRDPQSSL